MRIEKEDRGVLEREIDKMVDSLPRRSPVRARLQSLRSSLVSDIVPDHCKGTLEMLLELVLASGRIRFVEGCREERRLMSLFRKTKRGAGLVQGLEEANAALRTLVRSHVLGIEFGLETPGRYVFTLRTEECEVRVGLDREGVHIHRVGVRF